MSYLIEDSWVPISASAFNLFLSKFMKIILPHKERYKVGKGRTFQKVFGSQRALEHLGTTAVEDRGSGVGGGRGNGRAGA